MAAPATRRGTLNEPSPDGLHAASHDLWTLDVRRWTLEANLEFS